ncbi:prenylated flavin chaperone LpdD [Paenibacillus ihumii]|uniref:prenylated flavin chaperone LpdD n=1 Tax=Paenibacillus ihumii TaxID=687436 RepID=UPI0006D7F7CB|nr:hypothetical protein [Paenibacillus ihumii]
MGRFADLSLQEIVLGRDVLLLVSGGERHIGASSTAYWVDGQVRVHTCAVPGHKEHLLSEALALRAAAALERTVTLIMGIHYEQLGRDEIGAVSLKAAALVDDYLTRAAHG